MNDESLNLRRSLNFLLFERHRDFHQSLHRRHMRWRREKVHNHRNHDLDLDLDPDSGGILAEMVKECVDMDESERKYDHHSLEILQIPIHHHEHSAQAPGQGS